MVKNKHKLECPNYMPLLTGPNPMLGMYIFTYRNLIVVLAWLKLLNFYISYSIYKCNHNNKISIIEYVKKSTYICRSQ